MAEYDPRDILVKVSVPVLHRFDCECSKLLQEPELVHCGATIKRVCPQCGAFGGFIPYQES